MSELFTDEPGRFNWPKRKDLMADNKEADRYFKPAAEQRLDQAANIAIKLKEVITKEEMWAMVQSKAHIMVEGWGVLFTMMGFMPRIVSIAKLDDGEGWLARGELRDGDNELVCSAYASCGDPKDKPWNSRSVAAQISMAETRCVGKMGRTMGGHIVKLAGYTATPAEEMPQQEEKSSFQERTETPVIMPPKAK
jgi:hypothetical protein